MNPNRDIKSLNILTANRNKWNNSGHTVWNKGLTKETDDRVKKQGQTYSEKHQGETAPWFGKKHTTETKAKISATQTKNYKGISRYATVREQRQSYAEDYFDTIFVNAQKQYHVDRFFLDYAWPETKCYIEVDGEQHYTNEGLAHDEVRTKILQEAGWKLVKRIRWSEYQKLNDEEKKKFLNEVFTNLLQ